MGRGGKPRDEWWYDPKGPLQELRVDVPNSGGWFIIAQAKRELDNSMTWRVSALHPNLAWAGEELPFTSPCHAAAPGISMPCHAERTTEDRDARIARWVWLCGGGNGVF